MTGLRATFIGGGSYGATMAWIAAGLGHDVTLYCGRPDRVEELRSGKALPAPVGTELVNTVRIVDDLADALVHDLVVLALPPRRARAKLRQMAPFVRPAHRIVHIAKGYAPDGAPVSTIVEAETCVLRTGAIGGPVSPEDVWAGSDAAGVVASRYQSVVDEVTELLTTEHLRMYGSLDLVGVELAGALRTPMTLAAGMARGAELSPAATSTILTRGVVEGARLACSLGGARETLAGLSGIGDWMVVAADEADPVVLAGARLARGEPIDYDDAESRARAVADLAAAHGVEMPIVEAVVRVIDGASFVAELARLMHRSAKAEWAGVG